MILCETNSENHGIFASFNHRIYNNKKHDRNEEYVALLKTSEGGKKILMSLCHVSLSVNFMQLSRLLELKL